MQTDRLYVRISKAEKALLQRAAKKAQQTLGAFIKAVSRQAALDLVGRK